jgi:hypothetical protein
MLCEPKVRCSLFGAAVYQLNRVVNLFARRFADLTPAVRRIRRKTRDAVTSLTHGAANDCCMLLYSVQHCLNVLYIAV